jgi:hypothetical protein
MIIGKTTVVIVCFLLVQCILFSADVSESEKLNFKQDITRLRNMQKTFSKGKENSLTDFEQFADELQSKWKFKNKENYARIMLEVCGPLSSGNFQNDRRYEMARKYALAALEKPQEISVDTELELTGHVITLMIGPNVPEGKIWEELRRKDVEIRLHAWNRLLNSIDLKWDPNEVILSPNAVAAEFGFPGNVNPQNIKDITLRAEYEAAIEAYRQKNERYIEQNKLHKWLKRYPKTAEEYIVQAYSTAPYNTVELKQLLDKYEIDRNTQTRIINAVEANIKKEAETKERLNKQQESK